MMVGHGIDSLGSGEGKKQALIKTVMEVKIHDMRGILLLVQDYTIGV